MIGKTVLISDEERVRVTFLQLTAGDETVIPVYLRRGGVLLELSRPLNA